VSARGSAAHTHTHAAADCSIAAAMHTSPEGHAGSSSGGGTVSVLGYVTAAVPRGAPASLYPGGTGFCSVQGLWALRCKDIRPGSSRVLRAWLLNPGSNALRRVELSLLLQD